MLLLKMLVKPILLWFEHCRKCVAPTQSKLREHRAFISNETPKKEMVVLIVFTLPSSPSVTFSL